MRMNAKRGKKCILYATDEWWITISNFNGTTFVFEYYYLLSYFMYNARFFPMNLRWWWWWCCAWMFSAFRRDHKKILRINFGCKLLNDIESNYSKVWYHILNIKQPTLVQGVVHDTESGKHLFRSTARKLSVYAKSVIFNGTTSSKIYVCDCFTINIG